MNNLTGLQTLAIDQITAHPLNPRKIFEPGPLQELAASIKVHGVRQPVLVRPLAKGYQLVVGERRLRASKLAGKTEIPAIIDPALDDRSALEIMVIENLQREDVQPLEEAMGYQILMQQPCGECGTVKGHRLSCSKRDQVQEEVTAEMLAGKVGKSVGYIYARLKLLALIPAGREAFQSGAITAGHSVLIARLQPKDQVRAIAACFETFSGIDDLKDHDPEKVAFGMISEPDAPLIPEKALREWIQDNINLKLKDVPWALDDATLVPSAGACTVCPKRSTSNPALFAELAIKGEDTCFDAACYQAKRDAFVKITLKTANAKGKATDKPMLQLSERSAYTAPVASTAVYRQGQWMPARKGSCASATNGIIVKGEHAGTVKHVCVDPKCKEHKHAFSAAPERRASDARLDAQSEELKRHRAEITSKKKARARGILCKELVRSIGAKAPVAIVRAALDQMVEGARGEETSELVGWLMGEKDPLGEREMRDAIGKAEGQKLYRLLAAIVLTDGLTGWGDHDKDEREALEALAKQMGVKNAAAILKKADHAIAAQTACRACGCTDEIPCNYWDGGRHRQCSWMKDNPTLCSNPKCVKHQARKGAA